MKTERQTERETNKTDIWSRHRARVVYEYRYNTIQLMYRKTERQKNKQASMKADRAADRQTCRQISRLVCIQADRQTDRERRTKQTYGADIHV